MSSVINLSKEQLQKIYFLRVFQHKSIEYKGNTCEITYVIRFKGKLYKLSIDVCTTRIDDDEYIYAYHIDTYKNELVEVKARTIRVVEYYEL